MGTSLERTQLLSTISYACATVTLIVICILSDRINVKGGLLVGTTCTSCIVHTILLSIPDSSSTVAKILTTCLITSGLCPSVVLAATWLGINTAGFTKHGTAWAMAEIVGQCMSILGTHIYDGPSCYIKGHSVVLGFLVLSILCATGLMIWMRRGNKRRDGVEGEWAEEIGRGQTIQYPDEGKS